MNFIVDASKTSKENALILINISLCKKKYQAVLDSGSTVSFVQPWIAEQMESSLIQQKTTKIRLIQDTAIILKKSIVLPIEYEDKLCIHNFYLYDKMKYDILLGIDFMRKFNVEIHFGNTNLQTQPSEPIINDGTIKIISDKYSVEREINGPHLMKTVAGNECAPYAMVAISCDSDFDGCVGVFTPDLQTENIYGVKMYPSLISLE